MSRAVRQWIGLAVVAIVCVYAIVALRGPRGMSALLEKRREIKALQEQNATIAREIQMKRDRIDRLKNKKSEQELEIRRKLKMLRPGETQFILPDAGKTESASPAE